MPEKFESWSAYENFVNLLVKLNCIDNGKKIWWDVRPHPTFGTLEFRMCDVADESGRSGGAGGVDASDCGENPPAVHGEYGLAAVPACVDRGEQMAGGAVWNRGQADRFRERAEVPMRQFVPELLEFVDDVVDDLGSRRRWSTSIDLE